MHVGSVGHSWGTSRLWHDPNYEVSRDYRPQPVQRGITQGEALPKEDHLLPPERPQDPYNVQEQAYDVAAAQMNRGVEGQNFLRGRVNATAFDAAVNANRDVTAREDVTRTMVMQDRLQMQATTVQQPMPTGNVRPQETQQLAPGQVVKPEGSATTATEKDATKAAKDARDVSNVVDAVALGAGGVLSAAAVAKVTAMAPTAAAGATAAVGASAPAATTAAGAATLATHDDGDDALAGATRRG